MNYKIEHRLFGQNSYGYEEIIEVGDAVLLKLYDEDAEDYGLDEGEVIECVVIDFWCGDDEGAIVLGNTSGIFKLPLCFIEFIDKKKIKE